MQFFIIEHKHMSNFVGSNELDCEVSEDNEIYILKELIFLT